MKVSVEVPSVFSRYAGNRSSFEAEGETIGECLKDIGGRYPELGKLILTPDGRLLNSIDVFLNGESAYPDTLARPVHEGDKIKVIMIIQGG
jgi:molybdopterin converting factor small subunit